MSELKPCPFCGGEAKFVHIFENPEKCMVSCRECDGGIDAVFANEEAAAEAWNRRAQSANEPLTLEELREMHGQPVCCIYPGCSTGGEWFLINSQGAYKNGSFLNFRYYGEWLAYRAKPEPPEGEAND